MHFAAVALIHLEKGDEDDLLHGDEDDLLHGDDDFLHGDDDFCMMMMMIFVW